MMTVQIIKTLFLKKTHFPISPFENFSKQKRQISLSTPLRDRSRKDDSESCGMISIGIKYDRFVAKECFQRKCCFLFDFIYIYIYIYISAGPLVGHTAVEAHFKYKYQVFKYRHQV